MFHGIDTIITNTKQQIDISKESWSSLEVMGVGIKKYKKIPQSFDIV